MQHPLASTKTHRQGGAVLELLIALPVWLLAMLAVLQFGQVLSGMQHVALASRVGALEGSGIASPNVTDVVDEVDTSLANAGLTACQIILEHNDTPGNSTTTTQTAGTCPLCDVPPTTLPDPGPPDDAGPSVRVTVCVSADQLGPNVLVMCGINLSSWVIQFSSTFPIKDPANP